MEETNRRAAGIAGFWNGLSRLVKIAIIAGGVLLLALAIVFGVRSSQVEWETLYVNLESSQAAECYTKLEGLGYQVKIEGTGTIKVQKGKADEARLRLQQEGFPQNGFSYDLYSQGAALGATEADKKMYAQFQAEQNIAFMLKRYAMIEDATVMVVLAEQSQFALSDTARPASATVVLTLKQGYTLSAAEAQTIRNAVAASLAGLQPENVVLSDTNMQLYRESGDDYTSATGDRLSLVKKTQDLIQSQVYNLLAPVFGSANVTVSANVKLDFDKKNVRTITYTPPGDEENMGIIVSMRQTAERTTDDPAAGGTVGFDANGAAPWYPGMTDDTNANYYQYTQELNAEVNEVREQIEEAQGDITALSVAVFLDAGDEWEPAMAEVRSMVAAAVGVDADYITIMRTPFKVNEEYTTLVQQQQEQQQQQQEASNAALRQRLILIGAIVGGVILLASFVLAILALRKRAQRKKAEAEERARREQELFEARLAAQQEEAQTVVAEDTEATKRLNYIKELTENTPEMIAQLLRNWLTDDYGR